MGSGGSWAILPGVSAESAHNLSAVIKLLPRDLYENPTWKGFAYLARDFAVYAVVVWALVSFDHPLLLLPLWLLGGLATSGLFILGHDAAHGALFKSERLNYLVGQAAMLPALHVFEAWVLGHNRLHHGHTVRQEMDFVWHPQTREEFEALPRWKRWLHRVEWSALGAGVYYAVEVYWKKMIWFDPPQRMAAAIWRDQRIVGAFLLVFSGALLTVGAFKYGSVGGAVWIWVKVLLIPWIVWNYLIGAVVYIHHIDPEIEWWKRRDWSKFKGQMEGTTVFRISRFTNFFMHNIMAHVPHHVDMRIPFYRLPRAADVIVENYPEVVRTRKLRLADYLRATRSCKLYDFERGVWTDYEGNPAAPPVRVAA